MQSTLHTAQGKGADGRCNQDGCVGNWGRKATTASTYGALGSSTIDSRQPFRVTARFPHRKVNWYTPNGAAFEVSLSQGGKETKLLDPEVAGNAPQDEDGAVPPKVCTDDAARHAARARSILHSRAQLCRSSRCARCEI